MVILLDPYLAFRPARTASRKRQVLLRDLVSPTSGYKWAAILTDGYLVKNGVEKLTPNFVTLAEKLGVDDIYLAIELARKSGDFIEGDKRLSQAMAVSLQEYSQEPFFIRSFGSLDRTRIAAHQMTKNILNFLKGDHEEVEMCDSSATWYLRFKDDDPLIFLYAPSPLLNTLKEVSSANIVKVSGEFLYAY